MVRFSRWIEHSKVFGVWNTSNSSHIDAAISYIFEDIGELNRNGKKKAKEKDRECLKRILINLWVGFCDGMPISISLNQNDYMKDTLYGSDFLKYRRVTRIIDSLYTHEYIDLKKGYFKKGEVSRIARIWANPKLIELFIGKYDMDMDGIDDVKQDHFNSNIGACPLILRDKVGPYKKSKIVPFDLTPKALSMIDCIEQYNTEVKNHEVELRLERDHIISPTKLMSILSDLRDGRTKLIKGSILHTVSDNDPPYVIQSAILDGIDRNSIFEGIPGIYTYRIAEEVNSRLTDFKNGCSLNTLIGHINGVIRTPQWANMDEPFVSYLFYLRRLLHLVKLSSLGKPHLEDSLKAFMNKGLTLREYGIDVIHIMGFAKGLRRVFNRGDTDFSKGGRFYGAFHINLPSSIRKTITIDSNPTVEIDYSGLHIRMLYHMKGMDYYKDPYNVEGPEHRSKYKIVALIAINAERRGAPAAIAKALRNANIEYDRGQGCMVSLIDKFKSYHSDISEYLFSDMGINLQNIDSMIMNDVLKDLFQNGILALPVHDSIIVERKYEDMAKISMRACYINYMGKEPVLH